MVKMTSGRVVQLFLGFISVLNGEVGLGDWGCRMCTFKVCKAFRGSGGVRCGALDAERAAAFNIYASCPERSDLVPATT